MRGRIELQIVLFSVVLISGVCSLSFSRDPGGDCNSCIRRNLLLAPIPILAAASPSLAATDNLATRLAQRDPAVLQNRVFNLPPGPQVFPGWLRGAWNVESKFGGFLFPSKSIPKEKLIQNSSIAGFQKCSIATTADVGKEKVSYEWRVGTDGLEDRAFNLQHQIDAYLGYGAVNKVIYDPSKNPNRISIDFVEYRTVNAERIELFCNARESVEQDKRFVCAEYARQVTFGTGSTQGVPRQIVTNYANFWTWIQDERGITGNLLTAAYLDPQDPMYFDEPTKPVAVYSHVLSATPRGDA